MFEELISEYLYSQKLPRGQEIIDMIPEENQPRLIKRQGVIDKIKKAIENIVDVFEW